MSGKNVPKRLRHLATSAETTPTSGSVSGARLEEQPIGPAAAEIEEPETEPAPPKAEPPVTILITDEETLWEALGY